MGVLPALAAVALWLGAAALEPRTVLEVVSTGGRLLVDAAGTPFDAPVELAGLEHIRITAPRGIDPARDVRLEVRDAEGRLRLRRSLSDAQGLLPQRPAPVGDWWVDLDPPRAALADERIGVSGPFALRLTLAGRFEQHLEIVLSGPPEVRVLLRRGLINEDAHIVTANGEVAAQVGLAPRPASALASIASTCTRAAAAALALLAVARLGARWRAPAACARALRRLARRRRAVATLCAAVATATSMWVAVDVLERLPHTPDGLAYLLQARWLLDGALTAPAPSWIALSPLPFVTAVDGRLVAQHPPGWPALLAVAEAAGCPWVAAPLLGGLWVLLVSALGARAYGPAVGVAVAVLAALSPLARLVQASHLAHPAAAVLLTAALLLAAGAVTTRTAAAVGIALGLGFAVRPASAAAFAVVLLPWIAFSPGRAGALRRVASAAAAAAIGAAPAVLANVMLRGAPLAFGYDHTWAPMVALDHLPFGLRNADALLVSTGAGLHGWLWGLVAGTPAVALGLALIAVGLLGRRLDRQTLLMVLVVAAAAAVHLATRAHGLHGFGPRYVFEAAAPLLLLAARGMAVLLEAGRERRDDADARLPAIPVVLLVLLVGWSAATLPLRLARYRGYNEVCGRLERALAALPPGDALVLAPQGEWQVCAQAARRIGRGVDGEVLVLAAGPEDLAGLDDLARRPAWLWDREELSCVAAAR